MSFKIRWPSTQCFVALINAANQVIVLGLFLCGRCLSYTHASEDRKMCGLFMLMLKYDDFNVIIQKNMCNQYLEKL